MSEARRWLRNLVILGGAGLGLGRRSGRRIIALHDIEDREAFRARMRWLSRQFTVRPLRDLLTGPRDGPAVALTFDDGYASWEEVVWPVLDELDLSATFFVCSGFVGLGPEAAARFTREHLLRRQMLRPLTPVQLRRLADQPGFEIGSHTVHHADLTRTSHADDVTAEIVEDRRRLEDLTGRPVSLFAYPFGQPRHASAAARSVLEEAGFEWAFSIVPQFVEAASSRYEVGRDSLDPRDSERLWTAWLHGSYDTLYGLRRGAGRARAARPEGGRPR